VNEADENSLICRRVLVELRSHEQSPGGPAAEKSRSRERDGSIEMEVGASS
jgi:hypothetical protein